MNLKIKSYLLWFSTRCREFSICLSSIVANYDPEKAADISTLFDVGGIFGNLRRVTIFLKETQNAHSISANIRIKIPV